MEREILHIDRRLLSLFQERIFQVNRNGRIYFQGMEPIPSDLIFDLLVGQYVQIFHNMIRFQTEESTRYLSICKFSISGETELNCLSLLARQKRFSNNLPQSQHS